MGLARAQPSDGAPTLLLYSGEDVFGTNIPHGAYSKRLFLAQNLSPKNPWSTTYWRKISAAGNGLFLNI